LLHERHRADDRDTPNSVTLSDGTDLPADLLVYATGYGSMNRWKPTNVKNSLDRGHAASRTASTTCRRATPIMRQGFVLLSPETFGALPGVPAASCSLSLLLRLHLTRPPRPSAVSG